MKEKGSLTSTHVCPWIGQAPLSFASSLLTFIHVDWTGQFEAYHSLLVSCVSRCVYLLCARHAAH